MGPCLREPDARAHVDRCQSVVEDVAAQRQDKDIPGSKSDCDEENPGESNGAEVAPGATVEPDEDQPRSARGTGLRGSGPMYSDCGRIMRLFATCSSTC